MWWSLILIEVIYFIFVIVFNMKWNFLYKWINAFFGWIASSVYVYTAIQFCARQFQNLLFFFVAACLPFFFIIIIYFATLLLLLLLFSYILCYFFSFLILLAASSLLIHHHHHRRVIARSSSNLHAHTYYKFKPIDIAVVVRLLHAAYVCAGSHCDGSHLMS